MAAALRRALGVEVEVRPGRHRLELLVDGSRVYALGWEPPADHELVALVARVLARSSHAPLAEKSEEPP